MAATEAVLKLLQYSDVLVNIFFLVCILQFYALYKQSTEGPCTLAKPSFWDAVGRAKW